MLLGADCLPEISGLLPPGGLPDCGLPPLGMLSFRDKCSLGVTLVNSLLLEPGRPLERLSGERLPSTVDLSEMVPVLLLSDAGNFSKSSETVDILPVNRGLTWEPLLTSLTSWNCDKPFEDSVGVFICCWSAICCCLLMSIKGSCFDALF